MQKTYLEAKRVSTIQLEYLMWQLLRVLNLMLLPTMFQSNTNRFHINYRRMMIKKITNNKSLKKIKMAELEEEENKKSTNRERMKNKGRIIKLTL